MGRRRRPALALGAGVLGSRCSEHGLEGEGAPSSHAPLSSLAACIWGGCNHRGLSRASKPALLWLYCEQESPGIRRFWVSGSGVETGFHVPNSLPGQPMLLVHRPHLGQQRFPIKDQEIYFQDFHIRWSLQPLNSAGGAQRQPQTNISKWGWLCSNKTLFLNTEIWISCNFPMRQIFFFGFFQSFKNINIETVLSLQAIRNR